MTSYSCNLRGQCEIDYQGMFFTLRRCQDNCRSLEGEQDTQEAAYLVLQYDLDRALHTAPSDRIQVIRRLTSVTVPANDSYKILEALVDKDYPQLYSIPAFHPYLREQGLDELDFLLLELLKPYSSSLTLNWPALHRRIDHQLIELFAGDDKVLYELSSGHGHIPLPTFASLELALQRYVYKNIINRISDIPLGSFDKFQTQWFRLLEYFQVQELPYTEYIGQTSDDGFFGIFAAEEDAMAEADDE